MSLWNKIRSALSGDAAGRQQFLVAARQAVERIPGVKVVAERPEEFALELQAEGDASSNTFYLTNIFEESRHLPTAERVSRVERFLLDTFASMRSGPRTWNDVRERVMPVLRGVSNFFAGPQMLPVLRRPFLPFLAEAVVIDSDTGMQYVTDSEPGGWGVAVEEVFAQARRNLAACPDGRQSFGKKTSSPLWHVGTGDEYESSRLLLPGWLASFEGKVKGRPVAIVPDRRTLVVGGSGDGALLERMLQLAEETAKSSQRYLSMVLYTTDETGKVVPFETATDQPIAASLRHAHHLFEGTEYTNQKEHLNALYERDGIDIFVASYGGLRGKDGVEHSYSTWGEGVDSLLPRTDLIALGSPGDGTAGGKWMALVAWEDVERIAGECLQMDPNLVPPRYRTVGWPAAEKVAQLRALAKG